MLDFEEILNKDYFIVDCENFTYFARVVRAIGFEQACEEELQIIIDIAEPYCPDRNRSLYITDLQTFKTFKEAQKYAEKLNKMPENIKRRERFLKDFSSQEFLEIKHSLRFRDIV